LLSLCLLAAARHRGATVQPFKVGPDYLDPQLLGAVAGRPCRNLDPLLCGPEWVRRSYAWHGQRAERVLVEGVMGLFDGRGPGSEGSSAAVAALLDLPVVLVVESSRQAGSVAALVRPDGSVETARFPHGGVTESVCRSAISFFNTRGTTLTEVGPWAVDRYLADPMGCRFLQSFKTFAASGSFHSTAIHGKAWRYEELMAAFLEKMLAQSEPPLTQAARRLVIGRPVTYAGHAPDAALAQTRYLAALAKCGVEDVHFVYEPVAAAFYFAQRLERDATVLGADFGGGSSDFQHGGVHPHLADGELGGVHAHR
jgi:hypothetical protein